MHTFYKHDETLIPIKMRCIALIRVFNPKQRCFKSK